MKSAITKITGILFRAYFQSILDSEQREKGVPLSVVVIADSVEAAMKKVKAEFPTQVINSIHSENNSYRDGGSRPETILL